VPHEDGIGLLRPARAKFMSRLLSDCGFKLGRAKMEAKFRFNLVGWVMPKFIKLTILGFILLLGCSPLSLANAQGNSDKGDGNGHGNDHSRSEDSGGNQSETSSDNGNDGGNGHEKGDGNGNGNGNGNEVDSKQGNSKKTDEVVPSSTQAAPAVAQEGVTVKLETIYDSVHASAKGEIIDAQLVTVQGFLLYEIKLLQDDGLVRSVYYYAKSGKPVTMR
jgi:uncharacterized membrane protein YkoI